MMARGLKHLTTAKGALLVILGLALGLRLMGIQFGKPFRYHPDEIKLVVQAGYLLQPGGRSVETLFMLGSYPPLYTYVLAGLYGVYGLFGLALRVFPTVEALKDYYYVDTFTFHVMGRLLTAILGTGTVLLVYFVGLKGFNRRVGLLAALFCAVVFLHVRNSHYLTVDVPATFMATAAFLCAVAVSQRGAWPEVLCGGLLTGLAAATKYNAGMVAVPFLLAFFVRAVEQGKNPLSVFRRPQLYAGLAAVAVGFVLGCPLVVLDPARFFRGLFAYGDLQSQGKVGVGGGFFAYFTARMSPGYGVFSHNSVPAAVGVLTTVLGSLGLIRMLLSRRGTSWLVVSFVLPYYAVIGAVSYKTIRQFLPLVPFFVLAAGVVLDEVVGMIRGRRWVGRLVLAAGVLGVVVPELYKDVRWVLAMRGPDPRTLAKAWIETHVSEGTVIATEKYGPPLLDKDDQHASLRLRSGLYRRVYQVVDSQAQLSFGYRGEPDSLEPIQHYLARRQAEYFVSDSFTRGSFFMELSARKFPRLVAHRRAFYAWLDSEAQEVARFTPHTNWADLFPTIVVYRLPTGADTAEAVRGGTGKTPAAP